MSDPFARHGVKWLSCSSLNTFHNEPAWWVAKALFGVKDETGPAAARGNAVEAGAQVFLGGGDHKAAVQAALNNFALNTGGQCDDAHEKQRAVIPAMVAQAIEGLRYFSTRPTTYQKKSECYFDGIEVPIVMYSDWEWDDMGLDLKSTERMPSKAKEDHARQIALYGYATGKPFKLLYVSEKKSSLIPNPFDDQAAWDQLLSQKLAEVRRIALAMRKVLAASSCREEVAEFFCPKLDEFYWNDKTREEAARIWK